MDNLVPFKFGNHSIRIIIMGGNPMFSARDVTLALGYENPSKAYQDHCKYLKKLSYHELLELGWINPNPQGEYVNKFIENHDYISFSGITENGGKGSNTRFPLIWLST
jgi:hypothetical protein